MINNQAKKKVVIAGGGTAGWMTATALAKIFHRVIDVTLIESDKIGTVGVGEATIPTLVRYLDQIGLDESEVMRETNATFKLGISFENWRDVVHKYFHSFGITGKDHWTAGFQHFWKRGLNMEISKDYGTYCLELMTAEHNRFAHLENFGLHYAFHIDATALAQYLRNLAESLGVKREEGKIVEVQQHENGDISAIELDKGTQIEGDLFVDCTGFRALLIGETLGVEYEDWSHWLPCDGAFAVQTESVGSPRPYTRAIAHESGWRWEIPLQHRTGNGLIFSSKFMDKNVAREKLLADVEGRILNDPPFIPFRTGIRKKHWHRNCVAIGLSSGFLEPLESTSIHLIQRSIFRFMRILPLRDIVQSEVTEFNNQSKIEWEPIRDFIILHYKLTNRTDSEFWNYVRTMEIPDALAHRMDLFAESGRVFREGDELFGENSWIQVMLGQGIMPSDHHPIADVMSEKEIRVFLEHIENNVKRTVDRLPSHEAYIANYCRAKVPA